MSVLMGIAAQLPMEGALLRDYPLITCLFNHHSPYPFKTHPFSSPIRVTTLTEGTGLGDAGFESPMMGLRVQYGFVA
jgi:hypothetical protein